MPNQFDPYHKWLGIPPEEQPPNHYRLLGIKLFESDSDVIESAADRQMAHVHTHKTGKYSTLSQKVLNDLSAARICLLSPAQRAAYDEQLRARIAANRPQAMIVAAPAPTFPVIDVPAPALAAGTGKRSWRQSVVVMWLIGTSCVALMVIVFVLANHPAPRPEHRQQIGPQESTAAEEKHPVARPVKREAEPSWTAGAVLAFSMEESTFLLRERELFLRDLSGNGNEAKRHGADLVPGKVGQALEFKTARDFLECPDTTSLNPPSMTIAVWIKGADWGSRMAAENVVLSKEDWARKGAPRGYELRVGGRAGRAGFNLGGGAWKEVAVEGLKSGQWYFVAATFDGQTQRLFIDGEERASKSLEIPIEASPFPLNVARGPYAKDRHFVGTIDELAVWNRALTADEIQQLYDFSNAGGSYSEAIAKAQ